MRLWFELQYVGGFAVDGRFGVAQGEILAVGPEREQVIVMRAGRLAALSGDVDAHGVVPIA